MLEIVVAYYENSDYKNPISLFPDANIIIYDKSNENNCDLSGEHVTIKKSENIGREGETYLRHIIECYYTLHEYTLFIQDDTNNHIINELDFHRITNDAIDNKIPFHHYASSWKAGWAAYQRTINNGSYQLETFPHENSIRDTCKRFNIILPNVYTTETCSFLLLHSDRIRQRPIEFYRQLKDWLLEDERHGYVLEHIWCLIFAPI